MKAKRKSGEIEAMLHKIKYRHYQAEIALASQDRYMMSWIMRSIKRTCEKLQVAMKAKR